MTVALLQRLLLLLLLQLQQQHSATYGTTSIAHVQICISILTNASLLQAAKPTGAAQQYTY
jgi:hypothetical protein